MWRLVLPLGPGCGLKICAVSRALGDIDFKQPRALLSAVPDVFHCALQPHADRFAVFATDGVWAVLSDQQAVDCVSAALAQVRGVNACCARELTSSTVAAATHPTDLTFRRCCAVCAAQAERLGLPRHECAEVAAQALRAHAQERGSGDDITAVVALLEWEPAAVGAFDSGSAAARESSEVMMADDVFASAA